MKFRKLGDIKVSAIGLGCMGMHHAYGPVRDEKEMLNLISKAVDLGITYFDTAEVYGPFANEILVQKALAPYKDKVVISTKFGIVPNKRTEDNQLITDSSPDTIRKSLDGSLKRLKTDCIDLYYLHRVSPNTSIEVVSDTIASLIKEGKVKAFGLSEVSPDEIIRANNICKVSAVQSRYSMMSRDYEKTVFPVCKNLNIGFVAFSPLANGFLSGAYDKNSKFDKDTDFRSFLPQFQNYDANKELLDLLDDFASKKGCTKAQISLAWMLKKQDFIVPIPGTTKLDRLEENTKSVDIDFTDDEFIKINEALSKVKIGPTYQGAKTKGK